MAAQYGDATIAPGASVGWTFQRDYSVGFLPVFQVVPTSSSHTYPQFALTGGSYPYYNQLGISTIWSEYSDRGISYWYMIVQNYSIILSSTAF